MITLTLANGKQLTNLSMDGNNYVAPYIVDPSIFTNNLHRLVVEKDIDGTGMIAVNQYENMSLDFFTTKDGKTFFVINSVSPFEMRMAKIQANIDYLAMMTGNDVLD